MTFRYNGVQRSKEMIRIEVSGPEHSGKTSMLAYLEFVLKNAGMVVTLQKADPQLNEKLEKLDESVRRLAGEPVVITEIQTRL